VDPPTGSHVGGGFVRTGGNAGSDDERGLISAIDSINRAATSQREQPYAISAVAFVNGVSESQLLAQQHQTQLRLGELLALRTIARNQPSKVQELASLKSQGKRWSDLAQANGMTVATVAKVVRRANDLTVESYLGNLEKPGAPNIIRGLVVAPQGRPQGSGPVGPEIPKRVTEGDRTAVVQGGSIVPSLELTWARSAASMRPLLLMSSRKLSLSVVCSWLSAVWSA